MKKSFSLLLVSVFILSGAFVTLKPTGVSAQTTSMNISAQLELLQSLLAQVMELQKMLLAMQSGPARPVKLLSTPPGNMLTDTVKLDLEPGVTLSLVGDEIRYYPYFQNLKITTDSTLVDADLSVVVGRTFFMLRDSSPWSDRELSFNARVSGKNISDIITMIYECSEEESECVRLPLWLENKDTVGFSMSTGDYFYAIVNKNSEF